MSRNHKRFLGGIAVIALLVFLVQVAPVSAEGEEAVTFSEVMYDLPGGDQNREWVEIYNAGDDPVSINPNIWRFNDGANHTLRLVQGDLVLEPGEAAVLTSNDQVFLAEHEGFSGTIIDTIMNLGNERGAISLSAEAGIFTALNYEAGWGADGNGKTLEKIDLAGSNDVQNWKESEAEGGTPGFIQQRVENQVLEQQISLRAGWNAVSSYLIPENQNIEAIFASLIEEGALEKVLDGQGRAYIPGAGANEIGIWQPQSGYQVKVNRDCVLIVRGTERIALSSEVIAGWNLLAYPLFDSRDVRPIINGLSSGQILIVKNAIGRFYVPAYNFSNMQELTLGQAYWVKVSEDAVLNWNVLQ